VRAKQEVAVAIADERKLRAQFEDERKQASDWEQRAVLAVRESRDDLARQALVRQEEHTGRAVSLEETWRRQSAETDKLKASLRELNDKIEEAKRKKNLLVAKQKRAQAQKRIQETMQGLSDRSAFEAFDQIAERIEDSERRLAASSEVTEALTGDSAEKEFKQLEGGAAGRDLDERLIALKREMGLLKPSARAEDGEVREAEIEEQA
jgi:phage shock protein A